MRISLPKLNIKKTLKQVQGDRRTWIAVFAVVVLALGFSFFFFYKQSPEAEASWWNEDWRYRKKLTIDQTKIDADLTNFPVAVVLTSGNFTYPNAQNAGQDIRFTDASGTPLPHEIEKWNTSATSTIWVKVPSIDNEVDTTIYMYYGNGSVTDGQKIAEVWDDDFASVYHLNETPYCPGFSNQSFHYDSSKYLGSLRCIYFTGNSTTTADGILDGADFFDSANFSRLEGDNQFQLSGMPQFTLEAWVRNDVRPTGSAQEIIRKTHSASPWSSYNFYLNTDGKLYFNFLNQNGVGNYYDGTNVLATSTWYHVVALYDGTYQRVYINGVLDGQDTTSGGSVYKSDSSVLVGSGGYWDGIIDEVRVQTTARSEAWIKASYESGRNNLITFAAEEKGPGPIGYWKFDEGYGTSTVDYSSNNNLGVLTNMSATSSSTSGWQTEDRCISGKCLAFDGTNDYVDAGNDTILSGLTNNFSVSAWYKKNSPNDTYAQIAYTRVSNGGFIFGVYSGDPSHFKVSKYGQADIYIGSPPQDTNWHNVVLVFSSTAGTDVYLDGILNGHSSNTTNLNVFAENRMRIGLGEGQYHNGLIDEVKIYPYVLTADKIKQQYNKGLSVALGNTNPYTSLSEGLVGWWHMDGNLTDASGNANTGTASGAVATSSGKFGQAYAIGGGTNYISVPTSNSLDSYTDKLTVSGWYYFNNLDAVQQWLFDKANNYYLRVTSTGGFTNYLFGIDNEDYWTTGSGLVTAGRWYHVTFSYDGQERKLYIDGELKASKQDTGSISNGGNLTIGNRSSHTEPMDGQVDDIRVYNRTLSPDEVMRLYEWAPGPTLYFPFDEGSGTSQIYDISGNNFTGIMNGTMTQDDWVTGKYGWALDFDGSNDYISTTTTAFDTNVNTAFTYEAWFKTNQTVYGDILWGQFGCKGWNTQITSGGVIRALLLTGDCGSYSMYEVNTGSEVYNDNKWHHVASVYDRANSTLSLYLDGIFINSTTTDNIAAGDGGAIRIGANYNASTLFRGKIDEVKIYNYARNTRQIQEDMNAGRKNNPIGYWSFDEAGGQQANDYSGSGYDITLGASTATGTDDPIRFSQGKFNSALQFDGSNDYARASAEVTAYNFGTNDFSVSFYTKFTDAKSYGGLLGQGYLDNEIGWGFYYDSTGKITFQTRNLANISDVISNTALNDGQWHHIVGRRENGNLRLYIDGNMQTDKDSTVRDLVGSGEIFSIGSRSSSNGLSFGYYAEATLDEIKVYNYALTMDELRQNLNSGQTTNLSKNINSNRTDGLIGWWKMDEASWNGTLGEVIDSSGNGWNASSSNAVTTSTAKYGRAGYFNGSSKIDVTPQQLDPYLTNGVTLSAWIYPESTTGQRAIVGKNAHWATDSAGFGMYIKDGYLIGQAAEFGGTTEWFDNLKVPISSNTWSHVVFTLSGMSDTGLLANQTGILYINGIEVDRYTGGAGYVDSYNFLIGAGSNNMYSTSNYFLGYIDDVKVFSTVKKPEQILQDYADGLPPLGYWKLDDLSGTTAVDASGNGNTGTLTSGPVWKERGKVGGATWFDGSDDHILLEKHTALQNFSLSLWFNIVSSPGGSSAVLAGGYTGYGGSLIKVDSATNIRLRTEGDYTSDFTVPTMVQNTWYHLVVTRENSSTRLYLNGKESISGAKTNIGDFVFKKISGYQAGQYFNGTIDDVKLYDYALTQRQVAREYSGGLPVGYWKFDENEGVAVKDYSGQANHGSLVVGSGGTQSATSSAWTNGASGKINSSLNFDGNDDYVSAGVNPITSTSTFSFSAWLKAGSHSNYGLAAFMGGALTGQSAYLGYVTTANVGSNNSLGGGFYGRNYGSGVSDTNWHLVTLTFSGGASGTAKLYIDGQLKVTDTYTPNLASTAVYFGRANSGTAYSYNGQIDEVKMWNYELTPEEVRKEYNGGFSSFFR